MERTGRPEDIAALAAFFASDESGFITGQSLRADGGVLDHQPMFADELGREPINATVSEPS
ncbi:SDR family oxidoreductase [Novosphingobium sp. CECT 9465]|uniref:SDR family oxidoreductase n=1 Tax=Novosphingobium sp. CECT 9465 TaxID=2829794 RepID=UPI0021132E80|nr:SDR family oxidoreductase [Novosphingobium sp. CECT 9465]